MISSIIVGLEDDNKRQRYDRFGTSGVDDNLGGSSNGRFGQGPFGEGGFGFGDGGFIGFQQGAEIDMNDVMEMFPQAMGGGARISTI